MQLLVSDTDVEHYKQIKDDLDGLRLLVEKSELWVYKPKTIEEKVATKSGVVTPNNGVAGPGNPSNGPVDMSKRAGSASYFANNNNGSGSLRDEEEIELLQEVEGFGSQQQQHQHQGVADVPPPLIEVHPTKDDTSSSIQDLGQSPPAVVTRNNNNNNLTNDSNGFVDQDGERMTLMKAVKAAVTSSSANKGTDGGPSQQTGSSAVSCNLAPGYQVHHQEMKKGSIIDLDSVGPPSDHIQNYKTIQQILIRMNKLCIQHGRPRKHEQRLLRNMGVHSVVLDLLQIPFDSKEDIRMNELMRLAHEFLQNFCLGNQQNQYLLHKHLELFLTPGLLEAKTVCAIFQDNAGLCGDVSEKVVQHFVHCIESHGRHVQYLKFLQTVVRTENQFIR